MEKINLLESLKKSLSYTSSVEDFDKKIIKDFLKNIGVEDSEENLYLFLQTLKAAVDSIKTPPTDLEILKDNFFDESFSEKDILKFLAIIKSSLNDFSNKEFEIEKILEKLKKDIQEEVLSQSSDPISLSEAKDYKIEGSISSNLTVSNAKSATLSDLSITNGARLTLAASNKVVLEGSQIVGNYPKSGGNAICSVNSTEYVRIEDLEIVPSSAYNGIEIGLKGSVLPSKVLIQNCQFKGNFSNNAILIFGTQSNAQIDIKNCTFESVSNVLRLSNKINAFGIVVNIENCTFKKLESNLEYTGIVLCQDYTSNKDNIGKNNLFGDNKITINIKNCVGPNGKIKKPADIASVCGSKTSEQLLYVYANTGLIPYSKNTFPVLNIEE